MFRQIVRKTILIMEKNTDFIKHNKPTDRIKVSALGTRYNLFNYSTSFIKDL